MTKSLRRLVVAAVAALVLAATGMAVLFGGNAFADETEYEYAVSWQYYDTDTWKDWADIPTLTFQPGEAGYLSANVRAKLEKQEVGGTPSGELTMYAYASGVSEFKDDAITTEDVSGYVVSFGNRQHLRDAGSYTVALDGTGKTGKDEPTAFVNNYEESVEIQQLPIIENKITIDEKVTSFVYDGEDHVPVIDLSYDGVVLEYGENKDYTFVCKDRDGKGATAKGGDYVAEISFLGNYKLYNGYDENPKKVEYHITRAQNEWMRTPYVVRWSYGDFDPNRTVIVTYAKYDTGDATYVSFIDEDGKVLEVGGVKLEDLKLLPMIDDTGLRCYKVDDTKAELKVVETLNKLDAGQYFARITIKDEKDENGEYVNKSYSGIPDTDVAFSIQKATNSWTSPLTAPNWVAGNFDDGIISKMTPASRFGNAVITIKNSDGEVIYTDSDANGADVLKNLHAGQYLVEATVAGTDNYTELHASTMLSVFAPDVNTIIKDEGMPWWGVLLVVVGVLMAVAIVMFTLHIFGILHIYTGNAVMAMRKKADNDALIAAVRAGRVAASADEKKDGAKEEKAEQPEEKKEEAAEQEVKTQAPEEAEKAEEPAKEEPAKEEPAKEEPAAEEAAKEQAPAEEPAKEEAPAAAQKPAKKPAAKSGSGKKSTGAKAGASSKKSKTEE